MIVDARTVPSDKNIETDLCIVGGGVAGLTLARELSGQQFRVCVLESGGYDPDSQTQDLCAGDNVGLPYFPLNTARSRNLGGSCYRWLLELGNGQMGARLHPLDEIDFEEREWVPYSGWPFQKSHLDPYYKRAQSLLEIGPYTYDVKDWTDPQAVQRLPLRDDRIKTVIFQCCSRDVFLKTSTDIIKRSENVTAFLHATVLELQATEYPGCVSAARVATRGGQQFRVNAKVFALALGGIETPRLLLLSNRTHPAGIGNQNDLVGRFFMEHLHLPSGFWIPSSSAAATMPELYTVHTVKQIPIQGKLALPESVLRRERLLGYCAVLVPLGYSAKGAARKSTDSIASAVSALRRGEFDDFNRHLSTLFPVIGEFSIALFRKAMRVVKAVHRFRTVRAFRLCHMSEQQPNPDSRITLSEARDNLGQRRAQLNWQVTSNDIQTIIRGQRILDEELRHAGLGHVQSELDSDQPPQGLKGGWHHMGTTRMHVDAKYGVVNEHCCVHGIANLHIAGPSVFPTGGYANPTLTVVALAVRLADHLKRILN
jgi:choline dehydrogenase-like flavoprotein